MIGSQNDHLPTYNDLDGMIHLLHLKNSNRDLVMRLVLLPNLHIIYVDTRHSFLSAMAFDNHMFGV